MIGRLAIVGVGLLGGSLAKAVRAHALAREIVGIGRDRGRMQAALRDGALDRAERTGQSTMDVLDKALDTYRRKIFFDQLDSSYAQLRADPDAWAEHLAERKSWDAALMDGLDRDEQWTEDGRCSSS